VGVGRGEGDVWADLKKAQQNPFVVSMIEPFKTEMAKRGGHILIVHKEPPWRIGAAITALELGGTRPAFDPSQYTAVFDHSEVSPRSSSSMAGTIAG
jgi:hypothetical protein